MSVSPHNACAMDNDLRSTLTAAALAARSHAHAPYSGFAVGAALRDDQGRVHVGCNVENAAYPQGLCAEAVALGALVAAGGRAVTAVAVVAGGTRPVTPCGGCRQKLREFAAGHVPVHCANLAGEGFETTMADLLPHSFGPEHLT
jgi:cytidine deaminase